MSSSDQDRLLLGEYHRAIERTAWWLGPQQELGYENSLYRRRIGE